MTEEFAVIDFALLAAPPDRVVQALGRVHTARANAAARGAGGAPPRGLLGRLSRKTIGAPTDPLMIQPRGTLPEGPLARVLPDELGYSTGVTPFRVTSPIDPTNFVLVEFREGDDETSSLCETLSAEVPRTEIFRFRLSGTRHPGSDTAFHVYLDGRAIRRVASISAMGTAPEAGWQVIDSGMPHAAEADSLPGARTRAWDIMTPERQASILEAMGIDAETLFDATPNRVSVELMAARGGASLTEAAGLFAAPSADLRAPPATPAAPSSPATARGESWEAEVTDILIAAVAHALPEEHQVAWLTELTTKLEAGQVDRALQDAHALLAAGRRPATERAADAARLDVLFGLNPALRRRAGPPTDGVDHGPR